MSIGDDLKRFTAASYEARMPRPRRALTRIELLLFGAFFLVAYGMAGEDSYQLAKEQAAIKERITMIPVADAEKCKQFVAQRTFVTEPWTVKAVCAEAKNAHR